MAGEIQFDFEDMLDEINAFKVVAGEFLDESADDTLSAFADRLNQFRSRGHAKPCPWEIPAWGPLKTRVSLGGYEPDDLGEHNAYAEVTCIWEITPSEPARTKKPCKSFHVVGKASTMIRIREHGGANDGRVLAMWRMELGDPSAPGCFFHVQVLGEHADPPFPHSLSIPRIPAIAFTPMAAMEFAIGELFQDEWPKLARQEGGARDVWKGVQRRRLMSLLDWQRGIVAKCTGSPWHAMKVELPKPTMFVSAS